VKPGLARTLTPQAVSIREKEVSVKKVFIGLRRFDMDNLSTRLLVWVAVCAFLFITLAVFMLIFPRVIPFGLFELWKNNDFGTVWLGIKKVWWIFVWGAGLTSIRAFTTSNEKTENYFAESLFAVDTGRSLVAGLFEEMSFRWLIFFWGIVGAKIGNFLLLGIPKWLYLKLVGPVVNFFTFGKIHGLLFHPAGWYVGSALIAANAKFRDGHKYLGAFGYFNSWFCGFIMFWLMFRYGLLTAITIHALYDFVIFTVIYVDRVLERSFSKGIRR